MRLDARVLERVFAACFAVSERTVLVGGADEPFYTPARAPGGLHRITYRADYFASALHEVAHWCIAGRRRRQLPDYGYWYAPDGRSAAEQAAFERVEVAPQALEWIFADACGSAFFLSADNLSTSGGPSAAFAKAVATRRDVYLSEGLPRRAAAFRQGLSRAFQGSSEGCGVAHGRASC